MLWLKYLQVLLHVFLTRSKSAKGNGAAYYDPQKPENICFKIMNPVSVMSLELFAILEALVYIDNNDKRKTVICVDSKSALQHIARCASGCRGASIAYGILSKIQKLTTRGFDLRLQWVPSHIGLHGNEEADRLAKLGIEEGIEIDLGTYFMELLPKYRNKCYELWKEYFNERSKSKGIWYKSMVLEPPHVPWFCNTTLSRRMVVIAHRLRSGHIPLNKFGFLMKRTASPNCDVCATPEDAVHLLMECSRFQSERAELFKDLNLNSYNVGVFHDILSDPNSESAYKVFMFSRLRFS